MPRPRVAATDPPTYTSGDVENVLKGEISRLELSRWDRAGLFRPSFYEDPDTPGGLLTREARDSRTPRRVAQAERGRRYTYHELVFLRLLIHVRDGLVEDGVAPSRAAGEAAKVISQLRLRTGNVCPPGWRLLFHQRVVYLLGDGATAESLTPGGQLAMSALLTDAVLGEVKGRVALLRARDEIRAVPINGEKKRSAG